MNAVKAAVPKSDPRHHTARITQMLDGVIQHLREDISKISEPKAQALFETSAEVLIGLRTAFQHYEAGTEEGLRH
jgi:hypothetical protein